MLGYQLTGLPLTYEKTDFPTVKEQLLAMERTRQEAAAAHELARQRMAGRIKGTFDHFEVGQKVWLEAKNLNTGYNKKISTKREGPFRILEKLGPVNYQLELPPTWMITNNFHAILLLPYRENEIHWYYGKDIRSLKHHGNPKKT